MQGPVSLIAPAESDSHGVKHIVADLGKYLAEVLLASSDEPLRASYVRLACVHPMFNA